MTVPDPQAIPTHPDWLAVGEQVVVQRGHGRSVKHSMERTVARHTRTLVILDNGDRFKAQHVNGSVVYVLAPAYLDYWTRLEPIGGAS